MDRVSPANFCRRSFLEALVRQRWCVAVTKERFRSVPCIQGRLRRAVKYRVQLRCERRCRRWNGRNNGASLVQPRAIPENRDVPPRKRDERLERVQVVARCTGRIRPRPDSISCLAFSRAPASGDCRLRDPPLSAAVTRRRSRRSTGRADGHVERSGRDDLHGLPAALSSGGGQPGRPITSCRPGCAAACGFGLVRAPGDQCRKRRGAPRSRPG